MNILIKNLNAGDEKFNRLLAFLDGEDLEWSTHKPALQQTDVSSSASSAKEPECSHPSWAIKYIGGAEMCYKCGKTWGG